MFIILKNNYCGVENLLKKYYTKQVEIPKTIITLFQKSVL